MDASTTHTDALLQIISDEIVLHINQRRRNMAESLAHRVTELGLKLPPSRYTCMDVRLAMELGGRELPS